MSSAVITLQEQALDRSVAVSDLLRKALVISRKLGLVEFLQWTEQELSGYRGPLEVPEYRKVSGSVEFWNPYHGWCPVVFSDPEFATQCSERHVGQSVPELEHLMSEAGDSPLHIPFPEKLERILMQSIDMPIETKATLFSPRTEIVRIVEQVRTIILNWALKLEEEGILGEGLTFSKNEKEAAVSAPQNINNFFGPVQNPQIQQGNTSAKQVSSPIDTAQLAGLVRMLIDSADQLNIPNEAKSEMVAEANTIQSQLVSPKPKTAIIQACLSSVKSILEKAGGSAAGSLLAEIAKSTLF
jgi:hypothetical protein